MAYDSTFMDCYINMKEGILTIGNSCVERVWNLNSSVPIVMSLKNKLTLKEWIVDSDRAIWPIQEKGEAFRNTAILPEDKREYEIAVCVDDDLGISERFMKVEVLISCPAMKLKWVHVIYPGLPILRNYLEVQSSGVCNNSSDGMEDKAKEFGNLETCIETAVQDEYIDYLPLNSIHYKWKAVSFKDVTDHNNNLVKVEEGLLYKNEINKLQGNILFIKELLSEDGIFFIKEGPTPFAYQGGMQNDFCIQGNEIYTCGWGINVADLNNIYGAISTYGSAIALWSGDEEALYTLHKYHRAVHKFDNSRDAYVMSNTWGDRSKDGKVGGDFLLKELECAKRLGISFYQIDCGWQKGVTVNSISAGGVWEGYYENDPGFWEVDRNRFSRGLEPIVESADEKGINLGLWFSPDSARDFENWQKDADILITLFRKYGVTAFKLDGIKIRSKNGEEKFFSMMQKVVGESGGRVFFNLDTTAETRSGYFGRVQYGCIFLENRYTEWGNYYPHWTLRNLWMISKYYPTFRLQVEFLNVKRNANLYGNDILAPVHCGIEYSFAVTMFANPLAWMELSALDSESAGMLGKVIPVYRKHQDDILSGYILPIGEEPSGTSWTGFQSIKDGEKGYIIIIKEYNDENLHSFKLWGLAGKKVKLEAILGQRHDKIISVNVQGRADFELNGKFQYCLYRYTVEIDK
ncbi:MAG: hypothetical protein A2Y21_03105 [Clostridiales bacterium GWC2_40_7]|nr:MAG: hypothetical protein A2Y21_03105 [Clostridiales bacterium GWC2_40_7]